MNSELSPLSRINPNVNIDEYINSACTYFRVGKLNSFFVISTGYEDCNLVVNTESGKYVIKIFAHDRESSEINRYVETIEYVIKGGIKHPRLLESNDGRFVFGEHSVSNAASVMMEFFEGKNFKELGTVPSEKEFSEIIRQSWLIHNLNYHPEFLFDSWAIPNIDKLYEEVKNNINGHDLEMVQWAIAELNKINTASLKYCFVHGDLIKTNILTGNDQICIVDFSVANWYPRIQELSILAANLLFDVNNATTLKERLSRVMNEYSKYDLLTKEELISLYPYSVAAITMEFLGAYREKFIKGNDDDETNYWLELGRNSLKAEYSQS